MDLHSLKLDETMGTLISQNMQDKMGLHSLTGADHLEYHIKDPEVTLGDEGSPVLIIFLKCCQVFGSD